MTAMDIAHLHDFAHDVEPISSMQWKCTADGFVDADGREPEELDDRELAYRTAETLGHLPDRLAAALAIELRRRVDKRGA